MKVYSAVHKVEFTITMKHDGSDEIEEAFGLLDELLLIALLAEGRYILSLPCDEEETS